MRTLAAVLTVFFSVASGVASGEEFSVANSTANESKAAVAYGRTSGEYLVAYAKYRSTVRFNPIDIYVQRVKPTGKREGSPIRIFSSGDHWSYFLPKLSIAYNKYTSRYIVAWNWFYEDGRRWAIFTAEIGPFGRPEGGPRAVVVGGNGQNILEPAIVWNPVLYNFVLVWRQHVSDNMFHMFAANLGISGLYKQGKTQRLTAGSGSHENPSVTAHRWFNQILAVWEHWWPGSGYRRIHGTLTSGDASRSRVSFRIAERGTNPSAAYNDVSGLYLVAYHVYENGETAIKARHIRPYENRAYTLSSEFVLAESTDGRYQRKAVGPPDVSYNTRYNEFMMVYDRIYSQGSWGTDRDIKAALFYDLGDGLEEVGIYNTRYWAKDEYGPSIAYNEDRNEYMVIWHHRYDANDLDVHGRIVGSDGNSK